jgi:hypothetical protein
MSEPINPGPKRAMKELATKLIGNEQAERLSKLSPEERKQVLAVTSRLIVARLRKLAAATAQVGDAPATPEKPKS